MYKFLQRNGKKILAILGVFLMIAFIVPSAAKYGPSTRPRRVIGNLGKAKVYADDLTRAKDEWQLLTGQSHLGRSGIQFVLSRLGQQLAVQINQHQQLFYLLQQEAQQSGVVINDDLVNTVFTNSIPDTMFLQVERQKEAKDAIRHVLEIGVLRDRLAGSVQISEPMLARNNIAQWESVRLNLVSFPVGDYKSATTMPTTQQVEEQFNKYKGLLPDSPSRPASDSLGFGYQVPNRVKVQYLAVPRKQLAEAVRAGKSAYDWEVAGRMYYAEHTEDFVRMAPATLPSTLPTTLPTTLASTLAAMLPTTLPSVVTTQPATQPAVAATLPATLPAVALGPTTRPYAEVKDEIIEKLIAPDVDKLSADVTTAIKQRLDADWKTYQSSPQLPATLPTTLAAAGPVTQPAATQPALYDSYAYLESVAADIQRQFHVLPEVHQVGEWEDATLLTKEPGIGESHTPDFRAFPQYATEDVIAFNTTTQPGANLLHLFQPSEMLTDTPKTTYIFRLTAVSPAHAPDLAEIMARVQEDTRTKIAYASALDDARKLLDDAKRQGLSAAAVANHRSMTSTGNFRLNQRFIPNFIAGQNAVAALVGKARALLEEATPDHPHPVALVEMPGERKVVVVELADVYLDADDSERFRDKVQALATEQDTQTNALIQKWFDYDAVVSRLGYKLDKPESAAEKDTTDE